MTIAVNVIAKANGNLEDINGLKAEVNESHVDRTHVTQLLRNSGSENHVIER